MERRSIRDIRNSEFIQATLQAVQQKGFQNVTLSEIAAYASTTAASITYHFGSKRKPAGSDDAPLTRTLAP